MERDVKIFTILVILFLLVAIIGTYEATRVIIKPASNFNPPYAKVINTWVENGQIVVEIEVVNNDGYNISFNGGYVEIFNTGQRVNITKPIVSYSNSSLFNVSFPLVYNLPSEVTVEGLLEGKLNGNPIYITFSDVISVTIINEIKLLNFTYENGTLHLFLEVFSPLNVTLVSIENLSLVNYNLSSFVAIVKYIPLNLSLSPGLHYLNLSFNLSEYQSVIYSTSLSKDTYYVNAFVKTIIYYSPPENKTFEIYFIREF
ncbi:hypothetical protein GFS03_04685 [Sulfolobus sp. E5-1-F]|uniref:hypothetical protein n=1 Tax=Saccharolobus sp. E5-1-F TaxID=2663019 RepID=UPI001294CE9C|nr:hypothetical protein [Sulfolobus sp. E5-1-F]QGA53921.1 hypothetical protein GFS03_04685 [Sulfolobus sp. E5-1-F]